MSQSLEALRARVAGDPELLERLRAITPDRFVVEVSDLAHELGYDVSRSDLQEATVAARRAWAMRWVS